MATRDKNTKKSMEKKPAQKTLKEKRTGRSSSSSGASLEPLLLAYRSADRASASTANHRPALLLWERRPCPSDASPPYPGANPCLNDCGEHRVSIRSTEALSAET